MKKKAISKYFRTKYKIVELSKQVEKDIATHLGYKVYSKKWYQLRWKNHPVNPNTYSETFRSYQDAMTYIVDLDIKASTKFFERTLTVFPS